MTLENKLELRGEKKGEKKGEEKAKRQMAKRMKNDGMKIEIIKKYTGLSEDEIDSL